MGSTDPIRSSVVRATPPHSQQWDLQPGLENGERLCTAYEIFRELEPAADMEFDHAKAI